MSWGEKGKLLIAVMMFAAAALILAAVYRSVKRRAERFAMEAFGVRSLKEGLKAQTERLEETPKSVMAMTKVFLPQIIRDFPEFDWPQFRIEAERRITSFLNKEGKNQVQIHQTEIARYVKHEGICTVVIQSAAGYVEEAPEKQDGKRKVQTRMSAELSYIQDASKIKTDASGIGLTCPQCGAPVTKLGGKFCEYCGCSVTPVNIKVWKFQKIWEEK